jgi:hypothetical protein
MRPNQLIKLHTAGLTLSKMCLMLRCDFSRDYKDYKMLAFVWQKTLATVLRYMVIWRMASDQSNETPENIHFLGGLGTEKRIIEISIMVRPCWTTVYTQPGGASV